MHFEDKGRHNPPPINEIGPRIMCLSKMLRHEFNTALNELGLFSGQQDIVFALLDNEGVTLSELAKRLDVSSATASISIKRMEKSGFVEKRPDEKDARIIRLYPTELAKQAPERIHEHMISIDKRLKQDMNEDEVLLIGTLLERAIQNMITEGSDSLD